MAHAKQGGLQLVLGPMFSGKSTELIRRLTRYSLAGRHVLGIKNASDQRYSREALIVTHNQQKYSAVEAVTLLDVDIGESEVIGIDEGQFYPDLLEACTRWANEGRLVIVSMLDGDAHQEVFPINNIGKLVANAESIVKLTAVCHGCGDEAAFTSLNSNDSELDGNHVKIGGAELYHASCRACLKKK